MRDYMLLFLGEDFLFDFLSVLANGKYSALLAAWHNLSFCYDMAIFCQWSQSNIRIQSFSRIEWLMGYFNVELVW